MDEMIRVAHAHQLINAWNAHFTVGSMADVLVP